MSKLTAAEVVEIAENQIAGLGERIAELEACLLAVIHAYDDDDAPDPERSLSDAIQAARSVWRGGNEKR